MTPEGFQSVTNALSLLIGASIAWAVMARGTEFFVPTVVVGGMSISVYALLHWLS